MKRIYIILVVAICGLVACRQRYDPPVNSAKKAFLVVEANLNPQGPATISLTRTLPLETGGTVKGELNAQVTVEGKDNTTRTLVGLGNGRYTSINLNLIINNEYRLRIKTTDGKEYVSAFMKAKKTPVIDSIGWEKEKDGMRIYANTKDVANSTRYYRWDFDETWEIRSVFFSAYIYDNGVIRNRIFPAEACNVCWKYSTSSTIVLANSTRLANDVIFKAPIQFIENGSEKLYIRYSIMLRQYALDREAYNFFELMRKNTEDIGSLFSPQPSEIRGNITCVNDPTDYVLGYVTASTIEAKRQFIQVPWQFFQDCRIVRVPAIADSIKFFFGPGGNLIPFAYDDPPPVYFGSTAECVDCRARGGSTA
ncbi:MAG: DUF4249 domain-containing protein, partial [Chitinophagaceae bacterium]